tara:strand:- start:311 stop:2095 length:1785 start_codon:yes stop_codon:yes gene_type:complete
MENNMEANGVDPLSKWKELTLQAVKEFVSSAVVIDDRPQLRREVVTVEDVEAIVVSVDGLGNGEDEDAFEGAGDQGLDSGDTVSSDSAENENGSDHNIYIQELTSAFGKSDIPCSFFLPTETDSEDDIASGIAKAANLADILVLDWHLKDKSPMVAMKALRKIAEMDAKQNGRVRLICIYTGEAAGTLSDIYTTAKNELSEHGLAFTKSDPNNLKGRGDYHCLIVLQKQSVFDHDLPEKLLEAMTELADGILPSFAFAAIAALRKNAHHIASRFPKELDAAYVANRLITDPASDVDELMRSLIGSEFDAAIGLERVADRMLGSERIEEWIKKNGHPKRPPTIEILGKDENGAGTSTTIDYKFLSGLNSGHIDGNTQKAVFLNGHSYTFGEQQKPKIALSLHKGESDEKSKAATMVTEGKFARLVSLKREAFGASKLKSHTGWRPTLTLGTLLLDEANDAYLYCITPACDTVRLRGVERGFVFLKLERVTKDKDKKDLIVPAKDGDIFKLSVDPNPMKISSYVFKGDSQLGRVLASQTPDHFSFSTPEGITFQWLGEVRHDRAMRDMAELTRAWMRLGIMDSEYLRLAGRKVAPL